MILFIHFAVVGHKVYIHTWGIVTKFEKFKVKNFKINLFWNSSTTLLLNLLAPPPPPHNRYEIHMKYNDLNINEFYAFW